MAFNLKKVLSALLFSTSQPLSIKDIQAAFTRFHEQSALPVEEGVEEAPVTSSPIAAAQTAEVSSAEALGHAGGQAEREASDPGASVVIPTPAVVAESQPPDGAPVTTPAPLLTLPPEEAELYCEVPSLVTATQIREAMDQIAQDLANSDSGLLLVEAGEGYRLVTHPRLARWVRILRNEPPPVKLTQSVLETLAVIAYRQPVTRTEIEHIRGVSAEASLNKLLERELIYIVGRADLPGRPIQYGTTDRFLEFLGVRSLDELPASDVLSHKQIDEWLQNNTNAKPPSDADMGLPLELGEGDSPNFEQVEVNTGGAEGTATAPVSLPDPAPKSDLDSASVASSVHVSSSQKAETETPASADAPLQTQHREASDTDSS